MNHSYFIASSKELSHERLIIGDALMDVLKKRPYADYIRIVKWEYLDSDFGQKEKQSEYEDHLRQCDITIALFWKKLGIYTDREYQIAKELEQQGNRCYVLFKDVDTDKRDNNLNRFYLEIKDDPTTYCFSTDEELFDIVLKISRIAD